VPDELSPTARALKALDVLRTRPLTTADELADRLGVTERAARRYVGILREAGVDVRSERGPYGGYRLGPGTRLPPVVFTKAEALALAMAVLDSQRASADVDDLVGVALDKVIRALPEQVGRNAAALREHASTAPDAHSPRPDPATASALVEAVAARRRVVVSYRSESGREWDAEVDPWAVVVRHGRWYLLCHSHHADAIRTYRLDRVRGVTQTDERFTPPEGLDPVAVLEENLGAGWEFATRVVFEAPLAEVAPWVRPPMGRLEPLGERCVLVGTTSNPTMYAAEWLARLPFAFRVEGGPELCAAMTTLAAKLASAVEQPLRGQVRSRRGAG
jgi:predicted DNA-binding transcriptional regulator YafY